MKTLKKGRFEHIQYKRKKFKFYVLDFSYPRFNEIDAYNVLWNGHYVNYFECARLELCRELGFDMASLEKMGCYLPVYNYNVTMKKSVLATDEITIAVAPVKASESLIEFEHLMLVRNEVYATATVKHISLDKKTGEMFFSLPKDVFEALKPIKDVFQENIES